MWRVLANFMEDETGKGHTLVQGHAVRNRQSWDLNLGFLLLNPIATVPTFNVCVCVCVSSLSSLQIFPRGSWTNLGHFLRPHPDPQPPPSFSVPNSFCRFAYCWQGMWVVTNDSGALGKSQTQLPSATRP